MLFPGIHVVHGHTCKQNTCRHKLRNENCGDMIYLWFYQYLQNIHYLAPSPIKLKRLFSGPLQNTPDQLEHTYAVRKANVRQLNSCKCPAAFGCLNENNSINSVNKERTQPLDTSLRGSVLPYGMVRITGTNIFDSDFVKQFVKLWITVTQAAFLSGAIIPRQRNSTGCWSASSFSTHQRGQRISYFLT